MPIYLIKRSDGYIWALMTTVTSFAFAGRFGHAGTGAERPPIIHPQRDAGAANRRRGRARSPGNRNHHLAFAPWATGSNSGSRVTTELIVRGRRFLCGCFCSTRGGDLIETSTVAVERRLRCSEVLPTFYRDIHIFR